MVKIHWSNWHKYPKAEPTLENFVMVQTDLTRRQKLIFYPIIVTWTLGAIVTAINLLLQLYLLVK